MKYIIKQDEPQEFTEWKALANDEWKPAYNNIPTDLKNNIVKEALMKEQGYICCYCERTLTKNDSHIEHFKPQSDADIDPLDFSNMLCSCQKNIKRGDPRHCGNLKGDWFDGALLVSPLTRSCESKFGFKGNGTIYPKKNNIAAKTTIEKLGLDINRLNSLRKSAIEPFLDADIELSKEEFTKFVSDYLQKDSDGKYGRFQTTIKYLFPGMAVCAH